MTDRRASLLLVAVVMLVVAGLMAHRTYAGSGDDSHYLIVAHSLAFDRDLDLANNYAMAGELFGPDTPVSPEARHARKGRDGALRPVHDIGLPLLFAPYVFVAWPLAKAAAAAVPWEFPTGVTLDAALAFRVLIGGAMAAVAGLVGVQIFRILRRAKAALPQAAGWALIVTLSPPILGYSFLFFTELVSALLVAALYSWLGSRSYPDAPAAPPRLRTHEWGVVGAAIGLLLFVHLRNVALVGGFALWAVVQLWRGRFRAGEWAAFAAGAAVPLAMRAVVVNRSWGTVVNTPLATTGELAMSGGEVVQEVVARLAALVLNPDHGLLPVAPLYLLVVPGWLWYVRWYLRTPRAERRQDPRHLEGGRWLGGLMMMYVATLLLPQVNPWGVDGGFAPAARVVVPIAPLLGVAAFMCARRMELSSVRPLLYLIIVLQLAIDVLVWQFPKTLWNDGDGASGLLALLR